MPTPGKLVTPYGTFSVTDNPDQTITLNVLDLSGGAGGGGGGTATLEPLAISASTVVQVGNVSAVTALPGSGTTVLLRNAGNADLTVRLGTSAAVAVANDYLLAPGEVVAFSTTGVTHVAARSDNGSTLRISTGTGALSAEAVAQSTGLRPFSARVVISRPANATAYAVGALVNNAVNGGVLPTLVTGLPGNTRVNIQNITITSNQSGALVNKALWAVYFFGTGAPLGVNLADGQPFTPTAAAVAAPENDLYGAVPSTALLPSLSTNAYSYRVGNDSGQARVDSSGNLYLALLLLNAYTPANGEQITVTISGVY
jgi:hypothetical protein